MRENEHTTSHLRALVLQLVFCVLVLMAKSSHTLAVLAKTWHRALIPVVAIHLVTAIWYPFNRPHTRFSPELGFLRTLRRPKATMQPCLFPSIFIKTRFPFSKPCAGVTCGPQYRGAF